MNSLKIVYSNSDYHQNTLISNRWQSTGNGNHTLFISTWMPKKGASCFLIVTLHNIVDKIKVLFGRKLEMKDLIDYLVFYVLIEHFALLWRHHYYLWRAAKFRPMLGAQGLWSGGIFVVPHLFWHGALVFPVSSAPFNRLLRHTRGCEGTILSSQEWLICQNLTSVMTSTSFSRNGSYVKSDMMFISLVILQQQCLVGNHSPNMCTDFDCGFFRLPGWTHWVWLRIVLIPNLDTLSLTTDMWI
jgi:hypothetical protein